MTSTSQWTTATRVEAALLSVIAVAAAGISLFVEEARWDGPTIAMADGAYVAWGVLKVALLLAAIFVALNSGTRPYALIVKPLAAVLVLLAALQSIHLWVALDVAILVVTFAFLWRAYFHIHSHRDDITWAGQLCVVSPIGATAGWITVCLFSAIASWVWSFDSLRVGVVATAWQSALLVIMLLFIGFGIEQTKAHPAYAVGALWGALAIVLGAGDREDTTLMVVALVIALLTVALFFIERAMFRFRGGPAPHAAR